jgi:hypothetical protein
VEARWAHNPKVAGSNPAPATKKDEASQIALAFLLFNTGLLKCYIIT